MKQPHEFTWAEVDAYTNGDRVEQDSNGFALAFRGPSPDDCPLRFEFGEADRNGKCIVRGLGGDDVLGEERIDPYQPWQYKDLLDRVATNWPARTQACAKFGGTVELREYVEQVFAASRKQPATTTPAGEVIAYRRLTCAELAAGDFTLEYLIDWTLVAGQPCIVSGPKKACKTTVIIDLAISLATGGHFLGRFKVNRAARVLLMTGESGLATVQETSRRIAAAAGWELADIGGLIFSDQLPMLSDAAHLAALKQMMLDDEIEVLILDPAYLCLGADGLEGNLFVMGALLRGISELCSSMGVTLLLVHHAKKGVANPFEPPQLEDIAWSGFQEFARQWILLGRREQYEPGTGEHRLWLSVGGSAGHSALWALNINEGAYDGHTPRHWAVDVLKPTEAIEEAGEYAAVLKANKAAQKQMAQLEGDRKALVQAMVKHKDGETKSILKDQSGLRQGRLEAALASLLQDGTAEPCQVTRANKQVYDGYRCKPQSESEV